MHADLDPLKQIKLLFKLAYGAVFEFYPRKKKPQCPRGDTNTHKNAQHGAPSSQTSKGHMGNILTLGADMPGLFTI